MSDTIIDLPAVVAPPAAVTLLVRVDELVRYGSGPQRWQARFEQLTITGSPERVAAIRAVARPGFEIARSDSRVVTVV